MIRHHRIHDMKTINVSRVRDEESKNEVSNILLSSSKTERQPFMVMFDSLNSKTLSAYNVKTHEKSSIPLKLDSDIDA